MKTTSRVNAYVRLWEDRCYVEGIPDEVPMTLQISGRVPSYKAICQSILSNDLKLRKLGFDGECSEWVKNYKIGLKKCKRQITFDF